MKATALTADELHWSMGRHDQAPFFSVGAGSYKRQIFVDPYPGYSADIGLVSECLAACARTFPLEGADQALVTLDREPLERTNGMCAEDWTYKYNPDGARWEEERFNARTGKSEKAVATIAHTIVLSGKRIPIHPAMVRYLVAHEYGHAAFHHVRHCLGMGVGDEAWLEDAYLKLRGVEIERVAYSGGKWHLAASEIIANDFRVLVMGVEAEFWPHVVARPDPDGPAAQWWASVRELATRPKLALERCAAVCPHGGACQRPATHVYLPRSHDDHAITACQCGEPAAPIASASA